jgi:ribosomal protein L11 methyltransferase
VNYTGRSRVTPSTVARLETGEQTAHRIADLFTESFADEGVAVDLWDVGGARWRVALHFRSAPDNDAVRKLVATVGGRDVAAALSFARIAPADWVRESLRGLKPVAAGRFIVHGAHDRVRIPVNRIGIEIEAALAFGTGHHGTTRGCLLALDRLCKSLSRPIPRPFPCKGEDRGGGRGTRRQRDKTSTRLASARRSAPFCRRTRILDLGTGSGVLAIAAARALRQRVLATDIDSAAVRVARANARLNRAGTMIEAINADGVTAQSLRRRAPFALVFANILLGPLQRIAAPLRKLTAPGARIVLSGLLPAQANAALAAYRVFVLERRIDLDGWTTLVLARRTRRRRAVAGRPSRP